MFKVSNQDWVTARDEKHMDHAKNHPETCGQHKSQSLDIYIQCKGLNNFNLTRFL